MANRESQDHILAAAKAALNLIPFVGGAIASLIDDYVPKSQENAALQALELLTRRIESLAHRIDATAVNKEDFAELFHGFRETIRKTNRVEKLSAAASILANVFLSGNDSSKHSIEDLDFFMHCTYRLSIGAIAAIGAVRSIDQDSNSLHSFSAIQSQLANYEPALVLGLLKELHSLNLLDVTHGAITSSDFSHVAVRMTSLGRQFAAFVEGAL